LPAVTKSAKPSNFMIVDDEDDDDKPSGKSLFVNDDDVKPVVRKKPSRCLIVNDD
jgi:hypothetical protein